MRNASFRSGSDGNGQVKGLAQAAITPCILILTVLVVTLCFPPPSISLTADKMSSGIPKLQTGDLFAIVVGVSKYRDPKIPSLDLADKDAKAFGDFLKGQDKMFKEVRVTLLLDEKATKSEVEKHLYYKLPKAGKNDTIILFFSGHGAYDPLRPKDFLFLTYDAEPEYLGTTAVKMSGLEFLKGIEAERVLIIADACHSGGFSEMKPKARASSLKTFIQEVRSSSGRAIITSGKEEQLSWEVPNLKESVFTHNLIEGLKGKADKDHDGLVTLSEAYAYAYKLTKDQTKGYQHPQFEGKVVGAFPLSFVGPPTPPSELKEQIFAAARSGDADSLERLLASGMDVDSRDAENDTPLIESARNGRVDAAKLLLSRGADIEARNDARITALAAASERGQSEMVRLLLDSGACVDPKSADGFAPLALAAGAGHLDTVKLLLAKGADTKARTNSGLTALILAAAQGRLQVAQALIEGGADVTARDLESSTALTEAARNGRSDLVKLLLANGASIAAKDGKYLDEQLLRAALSDDEQRAAELLMVGANINAQAEVGGTPLSLAVGLGHLKLAKFFIEKGAVVNARCSNECTPLMVAVQSGRVPAVQLLLNTGASVHSSDSSGNTALMYAARRGHNEIVKLLANLKADLNARNRKGLTALLQAIANGHLETVRLLLAAGADMNAKDEDGNTPLIISAAEGHTGIVKLLCGKQIDLNARNRKGSTALMTAARAGHAPVVKLLLSRGAEASARDWEGKTALVAASESGQKEVVKLLEGE